MVTLLIIRVCESLQLAPDQGISPIDQPAEIRRKCEEEAQSILEKISPVSLQFYHSFQIFPPLK